MQVISKVFNTFTGSFKSQSHSNEAVEANTQTEETNDAAAPRSHNPQQLHSHYPTAVSTHPADSKTRRPTQPSSSSTIYLPQAAHRRHSASADEKRLTGDFSTPADAVFIPIPGEWNSSSLPMKPKSGGFQPGLNTIDRNPFQAKTTYGSPHRSLGAGQLKFLENQKINVPGRITTDGPYEPFKSPPRKRQKTSNTHAVDLVSDDEVMPMEVKSPRSRNSHSSPDRAPSMATSRSQRSQESAQQAWTGGHSSKHRQQPVSSFQNTDSLLSSRRKKSRTGGVLPPKSPSITKAGLLSGYTSTDVTDQDELSQESGLKSHHWVQNASGVPHMNPSTSVEGGRHVENQSTRRKNPENLRDNFRRRRGDSIEDDEQDELQVMREGSVRPISHRNKSPVQRGAQANTNVKRKIQIRPPPWPLNYARSTYFTPDSSDLALKLNANKEFHIVYLDSGDTAIDEPINLKRISTAEADDVSRIRLKGSRNQAGNQLCIDLQFANAEHFKVFCQTYVEPNTTTRRIYRREPEYMAKLHTQPLHVKDERDAPIVVDNQELLLLETRTQNGRQTTEQAPARRDLMIHKMSPGSANAGMRETKASNGGASTVRKEVPSSLTRQGRSTRNSQIRYDLVEQDRPVVKDKILYSEYPGLGKPWDKPLPYVHGKRRALVNFTDLERLDEDVFLNDSLIDFYLIYLFEQANIPADKVYFFNTMFYSTLTRHVPGDKGAINYAGVARWTAKEDLFNYDYIVVPINESSHWYLAIICNVNNIPRKLNTDGLSTSIPAAHPTTQITLEPRGQHIGDELALAAASDTSGEPLLPGYAEAFEVFDEGDSKINLVDADAVEKIGDLSTITAEAVSVRTSPVAETARMEELSLSDPPADGVLKLSTTVSLSAKRKAKKRPLPKYDLDKSIIVILDSLEGNHAKAVRVLKDYILEEGRAKRGMEATIEQKTFYVKSNHIPMQENFSDCGVFLLGYAEKFFANPREFSNRLLSREMDTETDWPNMNASEMRHKMRDILQDLAEKQKAEHKQNKKATKATKTAPPPPVKTDIPVPTPQLQSPFKEKPSTRAEVRSNSPPQPSPTLPPPVKTGMPAPTLKEQPPFQVKPPVKPEMRSGSPRQRNPEKGEVLPSRKERKPSPMVVVPSPTRNSPKRQANTSIDKYDDAGIGTTVLYPTNQTQATVEIRSPKRQKQSHAQTILARHSSPEKPKVAPRLFSKSPGPSRKALRTDVNQLYPTEKTEHVRNQRGSSVDPIQIDDSQDSTIAFSPKLNGRHTSVEVIKAMTSRSSKKTHRSGQSVEKPMQSITKEANMWYPNKYETRSPMDGLLSELGEEVHANPASREASLTPRRVHAAQNAIARQHTADKKDTVAKALLLDAEDEVIPDSPVDKRRSPSDGLST